MGRLCRRAGDRHVHGFLLYRNRGEYIYSYQMVSVDRDPAGAHHAREYCGLDPPTQEAVKAIFRCFSDLSAADDGLHHHPCVRRYRAYPVLRGRHLRAVDVLPDRIGSHPARLSSTARDRRTGA